MQKSVNRTIDPRAFDVLIDESFIRQGDLVKAVQDSLQQGIELEQVLLEKYRVPKAALGKALSRFFDCPYIPFDEKNDRRSTAHEGSESRLSLETLLAAVENAWRRP